MAMTDKRPPERPQPSTKQAARFDRRAAALRENLRRRKDQQRVRAGDPGVADPQPDGAGAVEES